MQDKIKMLCSKVTSNWVVTSYVHPMGTKVKAWYDHYPVLVKAQLLVLASLSAIPPACFSAFMTLIMARCLISGSITFVTVVVSSIL
ncbi:hypothetical protein BGZ74_005236 [Mortierella antarctica]|nr:hypothetical protein BGZ74_005236 [Mortierella antarctica]